MLLLQQMAAKKNCTGHHRLVKDMQHLAAHIKGPKLPQEVESALSLPVDSLSIALPVQSVVKVYVALHHLYLFSHDGNGVQPMVCLISVTVSLVGVTFKRRWLSPHHATKVHQFLVLSVQLVL